MRVVRTSWCPSSMRFARSSCSLLVQHGLVETVAGDLLQEIADQPCRAELAHRPRGLTQRLQHAVAEWQRFVWQRQLGTRRQRPALAQRDATLRAEHLQRAEFDAVYRGDLSLGHALFQQCRNTSLNLVGYP